MKFGEYLRRQREQRKWTQPEAAIEIGIEQSYLSKLETGKSCPSEDVFDRLVDAYDLDVARMTDDIDPTELQELKDIKSVRSAILARQSASLKMSRSWLLAGVVMLMAGAGLIGAAMIPGQAAAQHLYRSQGILAIDEDLNAFDIVRNESNQMGPVLDDQRKNMLARIDPVDIVSSQYRGDGYVEPVTSGTRRFFQLIDSWEIQQASGIRWLFAPGLMLLAGAMACFYVGRRWD